MLYQKTAEARDVAETASRAKSEFLTTMSHELRTPLNAILGYAQILQMELRGPLTADQRKDLQRIEYSERHLSHLINGILDFAKIGAGQMAFTITDVSVDQILSETDALIRAQIVRKGVHYHYQPCGVDCVVLADVSKLQQIVVNLLSNAIKFTHPDGTVTLSYDPNDSHVMIRVTDTGVGIPHDKLEEIFEPFKQLDNTLTRTVDGTGLGLSISRELARGMGGDISVTSVVGEGSTFTLTLSKSTILSDPVTRRNVVS
jgi:signal transduction histidine kinase